MYERFSESARQVIVFATQEARAREAAHVGTEHLLAGVLGAEQRFGSIVPDLGLSLERVRSRLPLAVAPGEQPPPVQRIGFSARAKTALEHALRESQAVDRLRIEPGDILHLHIVVGVAEDFRDSGRPFLQLVQQGTLGLVRAAEQYDRRTGSRFPEYATAWVRQAIARFVAGPRG